MRKIIYLLVVIFSAVNMMARPVPTVAVKGNLNQYKYVHVISTSGTTSNTGSSLSVHVWGPFSYTASDETKTVNPSELLSGFFMKEGFTVVPAITPEIADKTLIVSYGSLGTDDLYTQIILQLTDANTHEVVASYETSGEGYDDAERVSSALDYATELLRYSLRPYMGYYIERTNPASVRVGLSNRTPFVITEALVRLNYYQDGNLVHSQDFTVTTSLTPAYSTIIRLKRDKGFRGNKYKVEVQIINYK